MREPVVRCAILGKAEIQLPGIRLTPEAELQFGLALVYCTSAGRGIPREEVARLFWPDHDDAAARHCLRQSLYRLRALGIPVRSGAKTTTLDQRAVEADYAPVVAEEASASDYLCLSDLTVLPGYDPTFSAPFAAWVDALRSDMGMRMRRGLVRAIADLRSRGRYAEVERLARQCLLLDPLNEEATLALVEAVILAGGKVEAMEMIERYEREVGRSPSLRTASQLLRARIADTLTHASTNVGDLPFTGRTTDIERVLVHVSRLSNSSGVLYSVVGSPGVGKTRLCEEACRVLHLQGIHVVAVGAQPSNRRQPLSTISEFLPKLLNLPGALGAAPSALECLRSVVSGMSVESTLPVTITADSDSNRALIRWALTDLLDAISSEGPVLLFLDDAQYADDSTLCFLTDALRRLTLCRVGLLSSVRDSNPVSESQPLRALQQLGLTHRLAPLEDNACATLVDRFCSSSAEPVSPPTRDRVVHLSGGNPLLLLELLRHRRDLRDGAQLPISISGLLQQRMAQLPSPAKRVLQWCAVLGQLATMDRIQRCLHRTDVDMAQALADLQESGMVKSSGATLACKHELLAEAALELAGPTVLKLLHARAARVLSREVIRTNSIAQLWQCLHHWNLAGTPQRGLHVATRLARRLLAAGHATDALSVLCDLEAACETPRDRSRILRWIARAARVQRDWQLVADTAEKIRSVGSSIHQVAAPHDEIELLGLEARWYLLGPEGASDRSLLACVQSARAKVLHRLEAAVIALTQADNDGREDLARQTYAQIQTVLPTTRRAVVARITCDMIFEASFGSTSNAERRADDLIRVAASIERPTTRAVMLRRAAYTYRRVGNHAAALAAAREALAIASKLRLEGSTLPALEQMLASALDLGDFQAALGWLQEARDTARQWGGTFAALTILSMEARLAFESGDASCVSAETWQFDSSISTTGIRRVRQMALASRAALLLVAGDKHELDTIVSELQALHQLLGHLGAQDYQVSVLADCLLATDRPIVADALLNEYLNTQRRDSGPLPPRLARIVAAMPSSRTTVQSQACASRTL